MLNLYEDSRGSLNSRNDQSFNCTAWLNAPAGKQQIIISYVFLSVPLEYRGYEEA